MNSLLIIFLTILLLTKYNLVLLSRLQDDKDAIKKVRLNIHGVMIFVSLYIYYVIQTIDR